MDVTLDDCLKLFMKEEVLEALERPVGLFAGGVQCIEFSAIGSFRCSP